MKLCSFTRLTIGLIFLLIIMTENTIAEGTNNTSNKAVLTGTVIDKATGDPLIGARIMIKNKKLGSITRMNGEFIIQNIPDGIYTVVFTYIGYNTVEVTDLEIKANKKNVINMTMQEKTIELNEVIVSAKAIKTTNAALLKERQKAESVSDAIGAEDISRSGSGDAAAAMKQVTGATTVGGKYVFIRGLGERYSSTSLNGAALPSSDPDKKAVQFDMFPTSVIESIVTTKTATPDKPGDFTGGSVNIKTKSFPDKFNFSVSILSAYNTHATGNSNFLTYQGSKLDWLGYDDGTRALPSILKNADIPSISESISKTNPTQVENAKKLDEYSKAFNSTMAPNTMTAPVNQGLSVMIGDNLFDSKLGYLATLSYKRTFSFYNNGLNGRYVQTGHDSTVTTLSQDYLLHDTKGTDDVLWGGMANLAYNISERNRIDFKFMMNHGAENTARYQVGDYNYYGKDQTFETRVLKYLQRNLESYQLTGSHNITGLSDMKIDWIFSNIISSQDEPDLRFFSNDFTLADKSDPNSDTIQYKIDQSLYKSPYRYFRNLSENAKSAEVNFEIPLSKSVDIPLQIKAGLSANLKDRGFRENIYQIVQDNGFDYNGEPNGFFTNDKNGIIDTSGYFFKYGNYLTHYDPNATSYDGKENIYAGYAMIDWFLLDELRLIGGFRYEATDIKVTGLNESKPLESRQALINESDLLPSLNLVYSFTNDMNLRGAYSKTLARPTMRELAPYSSFDFVGGYIFLGNIHLERTLIDNYDLRWEYFLNPGEIIAISGFYKDFKNPQEKVIIGTNGEIQYQNVDNAKVYGIEFEVRKSLGFIVDFMEPFKLGMNLTLVNSQVDISGEELIYIEALHINPQKTRDFQGQSPYVVNLDLSYVNYDWGTDASIHYNVFGKRLSEIGPNGAPNVYEMPRPELNFVVSQKVFNNFKVRLSMTNLLDSDYYKAQTFKGKDYVFQKYSLGRTYSLSFSYNIN